MTILSLHSILMITIQVETPFGTINHLISNNNCIDEFEAFDVQEYRTAAFASL